MSERNKAGKNKMIKISETGISIIGNVSEVTEEMEELRSIYGDIKISELMIKLKEKWKNEMLLL